MIKSAEQEAKSLGLLQEIKDAKAATEDENRRPALTRLRSKGRLTAREQICELVDSSSFQEIGQLVLPARHELEGPADGLVTGHATIDSKPVAIAAFDYSVFAGTLGKAGAIKLNRLLELALRHEWPLIGLYGGGGARPQEMSARPQPQPLLPVFATAAAFGARLPCVSIVSGPCFAGNAAFAALCDVLIAVEGATIGLAGPALVEGAIGKKLTAEEIGPLSVQSANGVVDIVAPNEAAATALARRLTAMLRGTVSSWKSPDVTTLRSAIPENPRFAYDVLKVVNGIVDAESFIELGANWARSAVTGFATLEGRTIGVVANQPMRGAGAIDAPAARKMTRFMKLCDRRSVPILFLCDTPGLMAGPDAEALGIVRESAELLETLSRLQTPFMTVQLRKIYGLAGSLMGGVSSRPSLILAWPTAEFGTMGFEGAIKLVYGKELAEIEDDGDRKSREAGILEEMKRSSTAIEIARRFGVDDVIDPADTRRRVLATLRIL